MTPEKGPYSDEMVSPSPTPADGKDRLWLAGMAMQALIRDDRDMYSIAHQAWAMANVMLEVGGE